MNTNTPRNKSNSGFPSAGKIILIVSVIAAFTVFIILTIKLTTRPDSQESESVTNSLTNSALGQTDEPETVFDEELHGVFIASVYNINFPSERDLSANVIKAELDKIVENSKKAGINAIFFQVRPASDALYASDIFPTSVYLTGTQGSGLPDGFDPLAYITEAAHKKGIALHAWINPLRVTGGSVKYPQTDLNSLADSNPARLHPDWVVKYNNACMFYDAGIPEVRQLVANGVAEIVSKYDVDGIIFDDYFYPYPDGDAEFDDSSTYKKYGKNFDNTGDFRRDNINQLVKLCYDSVKAEDRSCLFGISPFGIWRNDDGQNGGSATSGLEAYSAIYCDALAWAKNGYIDYIAPQIYWQSSSGAASFRVLADWWSERLSEYGVAFCISHAGYKVESFEGSYEITDQIGYARTLDGYSGSIIYGYAQIENNVLGLSDALASVFSDNSIRCDADTAENEEPKT